MTTVAKKFRELTSKLAKTASSITEDVARAREEIKAKREEIHRLKTAPLPLEDIQSRMEKLVTETAAQWLKERGHSLISSDFGICHPSSRYSPRLAWSASESVHWGAWCAANPKTAVEFLMALVKRVGYEPGPPATERDALLAQAERELELLARDEEAFVDALLAAGLQVQHRSEVQERRENERRKRQIEEERVAERRRRQEQLNVEHASREVL